MITTEKLKQLKHYINLKDLCERSEVNYNSVKHRALKDRETPEEVALKLEKGLLMLINNMARIVYGDAARIEVRGKKRSKKG